MKRLNQRFRTSITESEAATIKAMLARGDRQHDIAAWFGVNGGRIAEIASNKSFASVEASLGSVNVPPPGPYSFARERSAALEALSKAEAALKSAREVMIFANK